MISPVVILTQAIERIERELIIPDLMYRAPETLSPQVRWEMNLWGAIHRAISLELDQANKHGWPEQPFEERAAVLSLARAVLGEETP